MIRVDNFTYFPRSETECKCGCGMDITPELRDALDSLRATFGGPLKVVSGARCAARNRLVGGASDSQHMRGLAADIAWPAGAGLDHYLLKLILSGPFVGVGLYPTFVHIDLRDGPRPVMWVQS